MTDITSTSTSVTAANTKTVERFLDEVVNGGQTAPIDELMTPDYVMHGGSLGDYNGLQAYKDFLAANGAGAFSGMPSGSTFLTRLRTLRTRASIPCGRSFRAPRACLTRSPRM